MAVEDNEPGQSVMLIPTALVETNEEAQRLVPTVLIATNEQATSLEPVSRYEINERWKGNGNGFGAQLKKLPPNVSGNPKDYRVAD